MKKIINFTLSFNVQGSTFWVYIWYVLSFLSYVGAIISCVRFSTPNAFPSILTIFILILKIGMKRFLSADDTAVVSSGSTWNEIYDQTSKDLIKFKSWLDNNILSPSINKTKCLSNSLQNGHHSGDRVLSCIPVTIHWRLDPDVALLSFYHKLNWSPLVQYVKQRLRNLILT